MTFLVRPDLLWVIAGVSAIGAIIWIWSEIRRPNRRQWSARALAAALGALALAALGMRPAWTGDPGPPPAPETAALWTASHLPGASVRIPREVSAARAFALAGAGDKPAEATLIPDVAFLRREFPQVNVLHVFGDGLPDFDADAVRGLRVIYHPTASKPGAPGIAFARLPRELTLGEPIVVQGRVEGAGALETPSLALVAPDGTSRELPLKPLDDGTATFTVTTPPAAATGRYAWTLELRSGHPAAMVASERIGVSVVPPILPRVLIVESSPRFDSGRLSRWLGERGAMIATRTQLSRDRFRISALHGAREEIEILDSAAFEAFDLVLADARAIAQLSDPEREALRTAVADHGLGLLVVADETMLLAAAKTETDPATAGDALAPWKLTRESGNPDEEDRLSRLQWPGSELTPREPLPIPPFEIARRSGQRPLVRDGQGRVLVVAQGRGRGQIALSLARETWRWPQADDAGAFAGFWSFLLSELARRDTEHAGRWDLASAGGGPIFVDQPISLRWAGAPDRASMPAQVTAEGSPASTRLPLAQSPTESNQWLCTYWPRQAGWHRVSSPNGARALEFYVSEAGTWTSFRAAVRTAATERIAAMSPVAAEAPMWVAAATAVPLEPGRGWFYAMLFACLTYLWLESRTLRRRTENP